jgi:hypothetical protein
MTRHIRGPREPYAVVQLQVTVTVELPPDRAQDGMACDDPAIECALAAMPQMLDVYLWGEGEAPARVYVESSEDDATIEEDCR